MNTLKSFQFLRFQMSVVPSIDLQYNIQNVDVSKNWRIKIKSIEKFLFFYI